MKTLSITTAVLIASLSTHFADAQSAKEPKNDPVKRTANQKNTPKTLAPIIRKKKSFIARSTLLASNGEWTLLPKGSVIHTPDHLKDKIIPSPGKLKIVKWKTFLRKNHGWIHTIPVSKEQSAGTKKISPEKIKTFKTMGKMVIAMNHDNPISVAPNALKPESESEQNK